MSYLITNGVNFLKTDAANNILTSRYARDAKVFSDKVKATNYVKSLPRAMKHLNYYVVEDTLAPAIRVKPAREKTIGHIPQAPIPCDTLQPIVAPDQLLETVLSCEQSFKALQAALCVAKTELSRTEDIIFDIEHAAEFFDYDADAGYDLYKRLREARIARRRCKDSIYIIESILSSTTKEIISGVPSKKIKGMDGRKFTPRVLTSLLPSKKKKAPIPETDEEEVCNWDPPYNFLMGISIPMLAAIIGMVILFCLQRLLL